MKSKYLTFFNIISIVTLFASVVLVNATSYRADPTHRPLGGVRLIF